MTYSATTVFAEGFRVGDVVKVRSAEVFATKLAIAGPCGHVPEVLGWRSWNRERSSILARKLDAPSWQAHFWTVLQCEETLRWLDTCDLDHQQRRRAQLAVARMHMRRQRNLVARRSRNLLIIAGTPTRSPQSEAAGQTVVAAPVRRSAEGF
jgi:hypothetical protein